MVVIQYKNVLEYRRIHFVWARPSFCYITFISLQRKQYFYATYVIYLILRSRGNIRYIIFLILRGIGNIRYIIYLILRSIGNVSENLLTSSRLLPCFSLPHFWLLCFSYIPHSPMESLKILGTSIIVHRFYFFCFLNVWLSYAIHHNYSPATIHSSSVSL